MNKVTVHYSLLERRKSKISVMKGHALQQGDAWTLISCILRHNVDEKPKSFILGKSILGGGDVLGKN